MLTIYTVANKKYIDYIPFFIYSINKAYPDYYIQVFCTTNTQSSIINLDFKNYELILDPYLNGKDIIFKRILVKPHFITDYYFLTDVDIFFIKEQPDIVTQHLKHMKVCNLDCCSNIIRPNKKINRLTLSHFVTKKYFKKLKVRDFKEQNDEEYLYNLCVESDIKLPRKEEEYNPDETTWIDYNKPLFRRHHGFHLSAIRSRNKMFLDSDLYKNYYKIYRNEIKEDKVFKNLRKEYKRIDSIFNQLENYYGKN